MKIKILLFGPLTDICDCNEINFPLTKDTEALIDDLKEAYPSLVNFVFAVAVNNKLIQGNITLQDNDIVSLLPPFSGG